jgi:hypothetical protein
LAQLGIVLYLEFGLFTVCSALLLFTILFFHFQFASNNLRETEVCAAKNTRHIFAGVPKLGPVWFVANWSGRGVHLH